MKYPHYIPLYINMISYAKCSMFVYWLGFCHHATCITCHVSRSWKKIQSLLQLVPSSLVGWVITLRWWEHLQDNLCFSSNVFGINTFFRVDDWCGFTSVYNLYMFWVDVHGFSLRLRPTHWMLLLKSLLLGTEIRSWTSQKPFFWGFGTFGARWSGPTRWIWLMEPQYLHTKVPDQKCTRR